MDFTVSIYKNIHVLDILTIYSSHWVKVGSEKAHSYCNICRHRWQLDSISPRMVAPKSLSTKAPKSLQPNNTDKRKGKHKNRRIMRNAWVILVTNYVQAYNEDCCYLVWRQKRKIQNKVVWYQYLRDIWVCSKTQGKKQTYQ